MSLMISVAMLALATLLVLPRQSGGNQALVAAVVAAAAALTVVRVAAAVPVPTPAAAAAAALVGTGLSTGYAAAMAPALSAAGGVVLGAAAALVAVFADLASGYAGDPPRHRWAYSTLAGPLVAFTAVAPVSYAVGLLVLH